MKTLFAALLLTGFLFSASASSAETQSASAEIKGASSGSTVEGTVRFTETPQGLQVSAQVRNAPPGKHGFHIHEFGSCADAGAAAGGHFNPAHVEHGDAVKNGPAHAHPGDMGNLEVGADGTGKLDAVLPEVTLSAGKYAVAGRAVILHEKEDDFGQPTGNAGSRIGCGPILLTKES
ncbi:MAG TPA: superoxide dismutase family protein [Candidatus Eisenbacteria bacterium]|jgi:Cu-Zn family superoxide dismutase|nr:superoxide dismutase family protein [Candidatus Eisenbacteria bacterium]